MSRETFLALLVLINFLALPYWGRPGWTFLSFINLFATVPLFYSWIIRNVRAARIPRWRKFVLKTYCILSVPFIYMAAFVIFFPSLRRAGDLQFVYLFDLVFTVGALVILYGLEFPRKVLQAKSPFVHLALLLSSLGLYGFLWVLMRLGQKSKKEFGEDALMVHQWFSVFWGGICWLISTAVFWGNPVPDPNISVAGKIFPTLCLVAFTLIVDLVIRRLLIGTRNLFGVQASWLREKISYFFRTPEDHSDPNQQP